MKVILFSGKAEAGKSLSAEILQDLLVNYDKTVVRLGYADYLKHVAKRVYGWSGTKNELGRTILQRLGSVVREKNPSFWADTVVRLAYIISDGFDFCLIDDLRYRNEIECWGEKHPLTVRVERPGHENTLTEAQRQHVSETSLDDYNFDVTITATDPEELRNEIVYKVLPLII